VFICLYAVFNIRHEFVPKSLSEKVGCCLTVVHKVGLLLKMEDCEAGLSYIWGNMVGCVIDLLVTCCK
jgi:hypothetical protein